MLFKSEHITQASGSIGGVTYAHNTSGMYRRARSIPVNPNSAAQQGARARFANASVVWRESLTQSQRDAWAAYAATTPTTNAFGDPLVLSGQQMFVRTSTLYDRLGLGGLTDAPPTSGLGVLSLPAVYLSKVGGIMDVAIVQSDPWANSADGGLLIQTSRFLSPAVNFFRSPFRYIGLVRGDSDLPPGPTVSFSGTNAFGQSLSDAVVGQSLFFRFTAVDPDAKLSPAYILRGVVTA